MASNLRPTFQTGTLVWAHGRGPGPAAGGDDAEYENGDAAASEEGPGFAAGVEEAGSGAGHDRAGDGDADRAAELLAAWKSRLTEMVDRTAVQAIFDADPADRFRYGLQAFLNGLRQNLSDQSPEGRNTSARPVMFRTSSTNP
jgi:hypothetical protein